MNPIALAAVALGAMQDSELAERISAYVAQLAPGGPVPIVERIKSEHADACWPSSKFFSVRFREYPLAVMPPHGFGQRNLAVFEDDTTTHYVDSRQLHKNGKVKYWRTTKAGAELTLSAWIVLEGAFFADGFFEFQEPAVELVKSDPLHIRAVAEVVPKSGDSGHLVVDAKFDGNESVPSKLELVSTVVAGVRPICQSTKLLDPDPIVRKMAERDLLVMGKRALPYLAEQRPKLSKKMRAEVDKIMDRIIAVGR